MKRLSIALVLSIVGVTTGCGLTIDAPRDFLRLNSKEGLKLTTADDARVWVREQSTSVPADLDFWTEALLNDLVERRGYLVVSDDEVTDCGPGRELVCDASVEGIDYRYSITVYVVAPKRIRTVEYLAPKEEFERYIAGVREARGTVR